MYMKDVMIKIETGSKPIEMTVCITDVRRGFDPDCEVFGKKAVFVKSMHVISGTAPEGKLKEAMRLVNHVFSVCNIPVASKYTIKAGYDDLSQSSKWLEGSHVPVPEEIGYSGVFVTPTHGVTIWYQECPRFSDLAPSVVIAKHHFGDGYLESMFYEHFPAVLAKKIARLRVDVNIEKEQFAPYIDTTRYSTIYKFTVRKHMYGTFVGFINVSIEVVEEDDMQPMSKVTVAEIEGMVDKVEYLHPTNNKCFTICVITLKSEKPLVGLNPFSVIGQSSCLFEKDYDDKLGREVAYKDALDKLWQLAGYKRHINH